MKLGDPFGKRLRTPNWTKPGWWKLKARKRALEKDLAILEGVSKEDN